ncbi:hypothetical protein HYALB_00010228 [Hymenoscyphus albidus]|uniref:Uncharacterized protein n=1 Tax=Hymenoscyphus albidus TaxID=595503 RepID=A0A9N9LVH3_9HELO|nr:hypothetical protein HYALB_00010228 [Hymenoscyphus albidus]
MDLKQWFKEYMATDADYLDSTSAPVRAVKTDVLDLECVLKKEYKDHSLLGQQQGYLGLYMFMGTFQSITV